MIVTFSYDTTAKTDNNRNKQKYLRALRPSSLSIASSYSSFVSPAH